MKKLPKIMSVYFPSNVQLKTLFCLIVMLLTKSKIRIMISLHFGTISIEGKDISNN